MTLEASISARRRLLFEALSAGASHLPPEGFRSVWVATPAGSVRVGRISPDALHALEKEPGIECDGGNVLLRPDWGEPLEALLERLGREARAKGLAPRWRENSLISSHCRPTAVSRPLPAWNGRCSEPSAAERASFDFWRPGTKKASLPPGFWGGDRRTNPLVRDFGTILPRAWWRREKRPWMPCGGKRSRSAVSRRQTANSSAWAPV